jgi:hypothetical protein
MLLLVLYHLLYEATEHFTGRTRARRAWLPLAAWALTHGVSRVWQGEGRGVARRALAGALRRAGGASGGGTKSREPAPERRISHTCHRGRSSGVIPARVFPKDTPYTDRRKFGPLVTYRTAARPYYSRFIKRPIL